MQPTAILPNELSVSPMCENNLANTPMPRGSFGTVCSQVNVFKGEVAAEEERSDPFPKPNDDFYGFEIVDELGRGAFGRVFLARERQLAHRPVVLKVTLKDSNEKLRLARLQHTNIVPIQNAFRRGPFHVVQMPYFGRQTLADVIHRVREESGFPNVNGHVFTTVAKASTHRNTKHESEKQDSSTHHIEAAPEVIASHDSGTIVEVADANPLRDWLNDKPYAEAVLAIMRRLADGLAHAHNRNILHLDLKPQNVLFSDDGQPMLLDFNLSADRSTNERKRVGGTWPYMAPEVIREFAKLSNETADERTDLYALGVIFFELLTCRLPFSPIRHVPEDLPTAIAEREQGALSVRDFNPEIPAAIDAIVQKLLAPKPGNRYQTVDQLREDLQRQQEYRPLRYAVDRNIVERVAKWHRRNPRAVAQIAVLVAIGVVGFGAFSLWSGMQERAKVQATQQAQTFHTDTKTILLDLAVPSDAMTRRAGMAAALEWMKKYEVGQKTNWLTVASVRNLDDTARTTLRHDIGQMALLLAHAEMLESRAQDATNQIDGWNRAVHWNRVAEDTYGRDAAPSVLWQQREELGKLLKDTSLAANFPEAITSDCSRLRECELFVGAARNIGNGKLQDAAKQLTQLAEDQPDHYAAQCLLALCYQASGQPQRALERFQIAQPLAKNARLASHNRAITLLHLGKLDQADAELAKALKASPGDTRMLLLRASILRRLGKYPQAIEVYTAAIDAGAGTISTYLLRGDCYRLIGNQTQANADRTKAESREAKTAEDFTARGWNLREKDPTKALEEYDRAIKLDPNYLAAWQNKACLLSEQLGKLDEALAVCEKLTTIAPSYSPGLSTHAVLLARAGRRVDAHKAIQTALTITNDPQLTYQAACVYAITSGEQDDDRATALNYLRQALREGYRNIAGIESDGDMKDVLRLADFQDVLDAAKKLTK